MDPRDNIKLNREHFDEVYSAVDVDELVAHAKDARFYLESRTKTRGDWHGLYHGKFAERLANKRVLELGCGNGLNALIMAGLGASVVAIDISAESQRIIQRASARLGLANVRAIAGDFAQIPFDAKSFDFVVGKSILHHLTHKLEREYLMKAASLLKSDGEARFLEPAVNSKTLDALRFLVPVPGRPSILNRLAFATWKKHNEEEHPIRDNSAAHYLQIGKTFFDSVQITPLGSIERLERFLPPGATTDRFRKWAIRVDANLPVWFRHFAARAQAIIYRQPHSIQH
jgi:2-polyprenyl-3-methyl-5-hydroxy-6-metoxy-1,4-benzoquinol methylase